MTISATDSRGGVSPGAAQCGPFGRALPYILPYRIDIQDPSSDAFEVLVELGALDVELLSKGIAAIIPDHVMLETLAAALDTESSRLRTSNAAPRDDGSVWLLAPRPIRIGNLVIGLPETAETVSLHLIDSPVFGTGHHATTALCIEAMQDILRPDDPVETILDVGTGSGILALAALTMGVSRAIGVDIDPSALAVAAENVRLNSLGDRFQVVAGGPEGLEGSYPLIVANILAAPLIKMAPGIVRRLGKASRLILSGIHHSLEKEVHAAYTHSGLRYSGTRTREGWSLLMFESAW